MNLLSGDTTFLNQYLHQAIKSNNLVTVHALIERKYLKLKKHDFPKHHIGLYMMLSVLSHDLLKTGVVNEAFHPIYNRLYKTIHQASSLQALKITEKDMCQTFAKLFSHHWVKTPHKLTNDALAYIHMHLESKLSADHIAEALHYSSSHLQHVFKKTMNVPLMTYIKQVKIEYAHILLDMNLTVSEIASLLHFYDSAHFIKTFKTFTGQTPMAYRNNPTTKP